MEERSSNYSWLSFKEAILKHFKRLKRFISLCRRWKRESGSSVRNCSRNAGTLSLCISWNYCTSLTIRMRKSAINQKKINSASLWATATALNAATINDFLDRMFEITSSFRDFSRKTPLRFSILFFSRRKRRRTRISSPFKKDQTKIDKDGICSYCKAKGHSNSVFGSTTALLPPNWVWKCFAIGWRYTLCQ